MRPALRYMGSKLKLAPWVMSFFPPHWTYCEPFGGGAGVLLSKPKSRLEVYNDLNGEVVNFFRVLRDQPDALIQKLRFTPYARSEHILAYEPAEDAVEQARRTAVKTWLSIGAAGLLRSSSSAAGFRRSRPHSTHMESSDFVHGVDRLHEAAERLRDVIVENKDAMNLFDHYDSPDTLFYCDPPYLADCQQEYACSVDQELLLAKLKSLQGFVVLSGYASALYEKELSGWHVEKRPHKAFWNKDSIECLWLSPRTWNALQKERRCVPLSLLSL